MASTNTMNSQTSNASGSANAGPSPYSSDPAMVALDSISESSGLDSNKLDTSIGSLIKVSNNSRNNSCNSNPTSSRSNNIQIHQTQRIQASRSTNHRMVTDKSNRDAEGFTLLRTSRATGPKVTSKACS